MSERTLDFIEHTAKHTIIAHRKYRLTPSNTTDTTNTKRQFVPIDLSL